MPKLYFTETPRRTGGNKIIKETQIVFVGLEENKKTPLYGPGGVMAINLK